MFRQCAIILFCFIGSLKARQAGIDINRLQGSPNENHVPDSSQYYIQSRQFKDLDQVKRSDDYDNYGGGLSYTRPQLHILRSSQTPYPKKTVKVHQPRENPKLYYQSEAYLKEISSKNIDHEAAATYPGREVIRVGEYQTQYMLPHRRKENLIYRVHEKCIRCPRDMTLVSNMGSDRVMLQSPRLMTCSGDRPSRNVKFIHMYGPKFGTYVTRGSYVIVGRITFNGETLHLCNMEVHVITQSCPVPTFLVAHCAEPTRPCNFTCKDSTLEILGETSIACGNNMEWQNVLPVCRARNWCVLPTPPKHGSISCNGDHVGVGPGLKEGSKCHVKCASEWRSSPRGVTVCRRGHWTRNLQCLPKSRTFRG